MKLEDIVALSKSGYTATQITELMKLEQPQALQVTPQQANPVPQQVQELQALQTPIVPQIPQAPVAQQFTQPTPVAPQAPQQIDAVLAEIQKLTSSIQNANILNTSLPTPESTDDILAQIINPKGVTNNG